MKRRNGGILVSYPGEFLEYEQRLLIPSFFPLFFFFTFYPYIFHVSLYLLLRGLVPSLFASSGLSVNCWTLNRLVQARTMFIHNLQGWNRKDYLQNSILAWSHELANGCIYCLHLLFIE